MKLRDFASGDFIVEGWRKVQYWDEHDECHIVKEGYDWMNLNEYRDWEVTYVFPFETGGGRLGICIEIMEV